jgi:hypothetical protein
VAQTVTVTGVDDAVTDGLQPYTILIGPATGGGYDGVNPADPAFTNADNDVGGITVGTPDGTSTSEAATTARVTLVLTAQPSGDVTIPISSSDTTEGTVSAASVVFTTTNWNVAQTVTVTGVDDAVPDGPQPYTILIGPATGGGYDGVDPADPGFTNADNDPA